MQRFQGVALKPAAVLLVLALFLPSCSRKKNKPFFFAAPDSDYTWTNISPDGGFISSVAFHPATPGEIWLSGDDAGGIYRSDDDGATWVRFETTPLDQSTYSLVFDPSNPSRVYAPNHFGRGFLKTENAGATWMMAGTGLPLLDPEHRVWDVAIDTANTSIVFCATAGGLFKSADYGDTFTRLTPPSLGNESDFRALAISEAAGLFSGTNTGRVYRSTNGGSAWTEITDTSFLPVSDLALTANALYIGYVLGYITRTDTFTNAGLTLLNDAGGPGTIESGMWTALAAVSGASANEDILYVGTQYKAGSSKWGFFRSADGGATFVKKVSGLDGNSVFCLAADPFNSSHIACGTVGGGLYLTTNSGDTWFRSDKGIIATDSLGFAEDPSSPDHLMFSSTEGYDGTPGLYETFDGGATWAEVTSLPVDAIALDIDPDNPDIILAGTFKDNPGIYRTTSGSGGPWTVVLSTTVQIDRFVRDRVDPQRIYVTATDYASPANFSDVVLYFSPDNGATWSPRTAFPVADVAAHPNNPGEAVAVYPDAYATTDSFQSAPVSLGLAAFAPGKEFSCIAFDPEVPAILLVGTTTGETYVTNNYNPSGSGVTWREVPNIATDVHMRRIVIASGGGKTAWYVACWAGDSWVTPASTPGLMRSTDEGETWTFLSDGIGSSRLIWDFIQSASGPKRFYAGLWGGGFLRLDE